MKNIKPRIDDTIYDTVRWIHRNRIKVLVINFVLIAFFGFQLTKITINTSTESYLDDDHPIFEDYRALIDQYGRGKQDLVVAVKGPDVFTIDFVTRLKRLHEAIEENVPYVVEVNSIVNARHVDSDADMLIVEKFFETWPSTQAELDLIRQRAIDNPLLVDTLYAKDFQFATILVETEGYKTSYELPVDLFEGFDAESGKAAPEKAFLTSHETAEIVTKAYEITREYCAEDFKIYISGSRAVNHYVSTAIMDDMDKFLGLSILMISIVLLLVFRTLIGVLLPLMVGLFALLSTIGMMVLFNEPLKLPSQILPSFLVAIGVSYVVHILTLYYQNNDKGLTKEEAIANAFRHSGLAIILTGVTTACGLLSFLTADLEPVKAFGFFASSGVLFALYYTCVMVPCVVSLLPTAYYRKKRRAERPKLINLVLMAIARFAVRRPYPVLAVALLLTAFSIAGITNIRFGHDVIRWMPEDSAIRKGTETIDEAISGSNILHVMLDFHGKDSLYAPDILQQLEDSRIILENLVVGPVWVGKAWSITALIKEINKALNDNDPAHYDIPSTREAIAQQLLLFENSGAGDLRDYTDRQYSKARVLVKVPYLDAVYYDAIISEIKDHFKTRFPDADVAISGIFKIYVQIFSSTIITMARSYLFTIITISCLLFVFLGGRYGLLSLFPNFFPIIFALGVMGWLDLPMNFSTMMVASIAIGLAVDDNIHFFHIFKKNMEVEQDVSVAIQKTFETTGRAIFLTTVILSLGFIVFLAATLNNFHDFGLLTVIAIITALLADLFIAPALLVVSRKNTGSISYNESS